MDVPIWPGILDGEAVCFIVSWWDEVGFSMAAMAAVRGSGTKVNGLPSRCSSLEEFFC
jgi:hypothetical protein